MRNDKKFFNMADLLLFRKKYNIRIIFLGGYCVMMRLIRPVFYNEFECIADKCSYSCCAGWNISIDSNTAKENKTFKGEIGDRKSVV